MAVTTIVWNVSQARGSITTVYLKVHYSFNGAVVAVREGATVSYLHGDHLGSISVTSNAAGVGSAPQQFDPWGKVRGGTITATSRNFTGQQLDDTGLLFYNARYYDPAIGRFISADTVVPGNASGGMDGIALRPLAVDFHEAGLVSTLNSEGANADKLHWGGPTNPQVLNRYAYVNNNPMRWTDPTGHSWYFGQNEAAQAALMFRDAARELRNQQTLEPTIDLVSGLVSGLASKWLESAAAKAVSGALLRGLGAGAGAILSMVGSVLTIRDGALGFQADQLDEIAYLIESANVGGSGVALTYHDGNLISLNRTDGSRYVLKLPPLVGKDLPETLKPGYAEIYGNFKMGSLYRSDCTAILAKGYSCK